MNTCDDYQKELAAFLYGEISLRQSRSLESHLESCPACRRELNSIKKVFNGADTLNPEMEAAMQQVDWEALSERIVDHAWRRGFHAASRNRTGIRRFWILPHLRPVFAALVLGILLGAALTLLVLRPPRPTRLGSREVIMTPEALESMDIEVVRRATLDYLDRSQYLLLDLVQASPDGAAQFWRSEFASRQAQDLLFKKKTIDQQLDSYRMAKARVLCDQIELLFLELIQVSQKVSAAELEKLQDLVQDRQLVMKIKLVKKELQESEV
jgi:hypothetical protein